MQEVTRVLVAGGGPVGMLLACELALQNVETVVIEELADISEAPRAGTLHARSVQSLLRRGFLRLPRAGRLDVEQRCGFHFGGLPILKLATPTAEGPPILNQSQESLERIFEVRARRLGVDVRRGWRLVRVAQNDHRVEVEAVADGRSHTLESDYLVGCDGARSLVRAQAGISTTTTEPTFSGLVGRVRLSKPLGAPDGWAQGPGGATLINVNPHGPSRVLTHDFSSPLPDRHQPVTLDELRLTAARVIGRELPMEEATYLARFSDYSSLADSYRSGRILLAGDAAHVHAPLGGQGLNTGIQDAFNLGWKLGLVTREDAPAELLDTYGGERRPVAQRVIANTRAQAGLMRPDPARAPLQAYVTRLFSLPEVNRATADEISGQGITCPSGTGAHPLTGTFLANHTLDTGHGPSPVAELLDDAVPLLLSTTDSQHFPEHLLESWQGRLRFLRISCQDPLDWNTVLCRPDGYIAWASEDALDPAALREALITWLGPPGDHRQSLTGTRPPVRLRVPYELKPQREPGRNEHSVDGLRPASSSRQEGTTDGYTGTTPQGSWFQHPGSGGALRRVHNGGPIWIPGLGVRTAAGA
ncbi:FAD-dependent monooxygenase [Streptomyces sp. NPDC048445]|uniref:FAD-dependent monooxygenase n=1 Tax=Streptomyces sp. NPDC048445 TaxID=3365553 RepID=UPI00371BFDBF